MKLIDLLKRNDPEVVVARLDVLYPEYASSHDGHLNAYRELLTLEPEADDGLIVTVSKVEPDEVIEEPWWDVSGVRPGDQTCFAIEFDAWTKWLGREVAHFEPEVDLLAHVLFEMTFCGYTSKDASDKGAEIIDRANQIMEQHDAG